jgi:hypothetical protein
LTLHPQRFRILIAYLLSGSIPEEFGFYTNAEQLEFLAGMIRKHRKNILPLLRNPVLRERMMQALQKQEVAEKESILKMLLEGEMEHTRPISALHSLFMRLAHPYLSSDRKQAYEQFLRAQLLTLLAYGTNASFQGIAFQWMKIALLELNTHTRKPATELLEDLRTLMITLPLKERQFVDPHIDYLVQSMGIGSEDIDDDMTETLLKLKESDKDLTNTDDDQEEEDNDQTGQVFVENAGLILLWPFLSTYFQRIDLMFAGKFRDEKSAYRAVHLLYFLATGQEQPQEYRLILNKVLCGVKTAKPVTRNLLLTDEEKELSEGLLKAVTQQWEPLKNTSISGLREAFLQRQGRLIINEENYVLRIEKKPYDILLDKLPWSIGMIKTSWMDKVMQIEWR